MCRGVVLLSDHVRPVCNRSEKTVHIYKFNRPRLLFHPKEVKTRPRCMNMKRKSENFSHTNFKTDVSLCVFFCGVVDVFLEGRAYITNAYTDSYDDGYLSSETVFCKHHHWLR